MYYALKMAKCLLDTSVHGEARFTMELFYHSMIFMRILQCEVDLCVQFIVSCLSHSLRAVLLAELHFPQQEQPSDPACMF